MPRILHPNTTQFPNVLLDHLLSICKASEWKALCYIVRRTYGWQRERERIPFEQLCNGRIQRDGKVLDRGTGLSRGTLTKAIYVLREAGVLNSVGERTQARTYWLATDIDPTTITETRLNRIRLEYDAKLQSLQPRLPMPPAAKKHRTPDPAPVAVLPPPIPRRGRERTAEERQHLLALDLDLIRKGRVSATSVARRRQIPVEDIQKMLSDSITHPTDEQG